MLRPFQVDPLGQGLVRSAGRGPPRGDLQAAAEPGSLFLLLFFFLFFFFFERGLRLDYRRAQGRADVPDGRDPAARRGVGAFVEETRFSSKKYPPFFSLCVSFFSFFSFSPRSDEKTLATSFLLLPLFPSFSLSVSLSLSFSFQQEAWLDLAAGLLPTDCVASAACHEPSEARTATAAAAAGAGGGGGDRRQSGAAALASLLEKNCPREKQHLFSLYVHTPKGVDFLEVREGGFCLFFVFRSKLFA